MRCSICDSNDQGLSEFRVDGRIPHSFHTAPNGDLLCDECFGWGEELESDYYIDEEGDE